MEGLSVANAELLAGEGGVASAPVVYDNGDALAALVGSNDSALLLGSTESDDSDLTAPDAPRRTRKKRRATYLRTKDEREKLQSEIDDLELRLAVLKKRAGIGGEAEPEQPVVLNSVLRSLVTQQQMAMAGVQSMVAKSLCEQSSNPLYSHVYLDKDWTSRRATMHALKSTKLQNGLQYLTERSRHLDPLVPYATTEMTQDAEGNVLCSDFEVIQFVGVKSVRQLYDATHFFFINEEISLSERLGHLTIRDDYDKVDGAGVNSRMYSIDENGVMAEWSAVSFAECVDGNGVPPEQAYAVLATDCVDDDALYPYNSANRVRKDRSGAISLTVAKRPKSQLSAADGEEEFVVVMRAASICKLHRPPFPLSVGAKEGLVRGMLRWSDAMLDTIRSKLSTSGVVLK